MPRLLVLLTSALLCSYACAQPYDTLIRNARVLDGTGNPWFYADVAISGDRIAAIGNLEDANAMNTVDATGLYLAPGFIDSHSHTSAGLAAEDRSDAKPLLAQGMTTVIINPDGGGPTDMDRQREDLLRHGLGLNTIQMVPHGSVRREVLGMQNRRPTGEELEAMVAIVREGMQAGAWGLSSGPFYPPGSFSDTPELIALAKVTAAFGGVYTSHIRDESNYSIGVVAAVDEVIEISKEANLPGIVTHIKVLGPPVWGYAHALVQRINRARANGLEIYADQYPYIASATGLGAALVPRWAVAGDSLQIHLKDAHAKARIKKDMTENLARRGGADRIQFRFYAPDRTVEGRLLSEVAADWKLDTIDAALNMVSAGDAGIVSFNMNEKDVETLMVQPWTMTSSDGSYPTWNNGVPHPRAFGTFPRKIRKYVMEEGVMDLPAAIRSMTSLPAQVFNIPDRGVIRTGAFADLVLFNLEQLTDKATFTAPYQMAEGITHVWVNGEAARRDGLSTGTMAGRVLNKN